MAEDVEAVCAALTDALTGKGDDNERDAVAELRKRLRDAVPACLRRHYQRSKRAGARAAALFYSLPYARWSDAAYRLGVEALVDSSKVVRFRAASLLAYALREDAVPSLRAALACAVDEETREHFRAAIDAIEHANHHFFRDRDHSGMVSWEVDEIPRAQAPPAK